MVSIETVFKKIRFFIKTEQEKSEGKTSEIQLYDFLKRQDLIKVREYTSHVKDEYPELNELNQLAKEIGINEVYLSCDWNSIGVSYIENPFFSWVVFPQKCVVNYRELKSFKPKLARKGIELILMHEKEHLHGKAFQFLQYKEKEYNQFLNQFTLEGKATAATAKSFYDDASYADELVEIQLREKYVDDTKFMNDKIIEYLCIKVLYRGVKGALNSKESAWDFCQCYEPIGIDYKTRLKAYKKYDILKRRLREECKM